ncbi:MAG: chemotaxis protein CheW [Peptococcia bacterium]
MVEHQFIVFSLNNEEFGLAINTVREIVQLQKIINLPQESELIEGIMSLRKEILPVVDLKKRFYGMAAGDVETNRIIVVDIGGWLVGIIVDEVLEVLSLQEKDIVPLPPFVQRVTADCGLQGVGRFSGRLVILLDLSQAFSGDEKSLLQEAVN